MSSNSIISQIEAEQMDKEIPEFDPGDTGAVRTPKPSCEKIRASPPPSRPRFARTRACPTPRCARSSANQKPAAKPRPAPTPERPGLGAGT